MPRLEVNRQNVVTQQTRLRNVVFTLNNPPSEQTPAKIWDALKHMAVYLVLQKEKGESGTIHYQGYFELDKRYRFNTVKKVLPRANLRARRGTQEQAINYCRKEETRLEGPFEFGEKKNDQSGKRNDVIGFRDAIQDGATNYELLETHPREMARFWRFPDTVRQARPPAIRQNLVVEVHFGPPGTGKTYQVFERFPMKDIYTVPIGPRLWLNGYEGHPVILIDDFSGQMQFKDLLRLLDKYPLQAEKKGGHVWVQAERIIITSNRHYNKWYDFNGRWNATDLKALERRIGTLIEYKEIGETVVRRVHTGSG